MDVLRTVVSSLSFFDPEEKVNTKDANYHKAQRLVSQIAMIVAAYDRIRKGLPLVEPDRTLSHAGELPADADRREAKRDLAIRALETFALTLHADHDPNPPPFLRA